MIMGEFRGAQLCKTSKAGAALVGGDAGKKLKLGQP
jgi:hypothetical protein